MIISILLVFSYPLLDRMQLLSEEKNSVDQLVSLCEQLHYKTQKTQTSWYLWIEPSAGTLWMTHDKMDEEDIASAKEKSIDLPGNLTITQVKIVNAPPQEETEYRIRFHSQGYSDYALIYLRKDDQPITIEIQPFLPKPRIIDSHVDIEECK